MSSDAAYRDALPLGTELNGYTIRGVLGRGGFGITYHATDQISQSFALKEYFPGQFALRHGLSIVARSSEEQPDFDNCRARFLAEAKVLSRLSQTTDDKSIVKIITLFEANGTAYIVMECLSGEGLDRVLQRYPMGLPAEQLQHLLVQVLHALHNVHDVGLVHRDLKPSNIFLHKDGRPVLIDFGAAREVIRGDETTYTQIASGGYAPIEQVFGWRQGAFSDIYALGATCYRAIGGRLVNSSNRQQAIVEGKPDPLPPASRIGAGRYPPALLTMIDRAMAVDADRRPQSIEEVLAILGDTLSIGDSTVVAAASPHQRGAAVRPANDPRPGGDARRLAETSRHSDKAGLRLIPSLARLLLRPIAKQGKARATVLGLVAVCIVASATAYFHAALMDKSPVADAGDDAGRHAGASVGQPSKAMPDDGIGSSATAARQINTPSPSLSAPKSRPTPEPTPPLAPTPRPPPAPTPPPQIAQPVPPVPPPAATNQVSDAQAGEAALALPQSQWVLVQRSLAVFGLVPGPIDGVPGDRTRQAVRQFQHRQAVDETGYLSRQTLADLLAKAREPLDREDRLKAAAAAAAEQQDNGATDAAPSTARAGGNGTTIGPQPGSEEDLVANVGDRVFFDTNNADLKPDARATLDRQAVWLTIHPQLEVVIAGNADDWEAEANGSTPDLAVTLGWHRAESVMNYLAAKGIARSRISTISYGNRRPIVRRPDETARAQNRAVITQVN